MVDQVLSGGVKKEKRQDGKMETFLSVWEDINNQYLNSDKYTTGEFYIRAYNSFKLIVGDIQGFNVDAEVVKKWKDGMTNGADVKVPVLYTRYLSGKRKGEVTERIILDKKTLDEVKESITNDKQYKKGARRKRILKMENRTVSQLSVTSVGINLRTFRAVWNAIVKKGYLQNVPYPFDKVEDDI